jgi:hypothetical protein
MTGRIREFSFVRHGAAIPEGAELSPLHDTHHGRHVLGMAVREITMPKASEILTTAAQLVGGDRERTHGSKLQNHQAIADVWNGILKARARWRPAEDPLDARDVALMMIGLKVARAYGGAHNPDDYIDMAGYAGCAGEIAAIMRAPSE